MSEYSKVIDDFYELAEQQGLSKPNTAWLTINGIWWPNPHYKGEPVVHPEDSSGTQTNPPFSTQDLKERCLQKQRGKK